MYVMSVHHTSSASLMFRPLSKYGYFRCPLSGMLVRLGGEATFFL